ncbi:hypothetical protein CFC21_010923 [Triticum aestivum]|uniref:Histidine-containing phosphotransfer protein n=2 Tax=Triticum aestivum TaxID=4565 RepID=A0A9R1DLR8_WHEAT|nr:hypothetical protein CFC21_010923 [Triticum aestivum]
MDYSNLRRQITFMKKSFFDQGYLDEQFNQLEELQDESSPNFVEEVVALFLKDSPRLLSNIEQTIGKYPQDFYRLDSLVHQLKGSGSSIGAVRMKNECSVFKAHCNDRNLEGVSMVVHQMPQVTAEDEEGACHSEAEAGVIFSVTAASRASRACRELKEVRR